MNTFITAYGPKQKVVHEPGGPSLTRQSMKDECDIKFILSRFEKTGIITHQARYQGQYGDFEPFDFHDAMNVVARANEMFATLPSHVRKRFGNDPGAFLDYAQDPANIDGMRELGLAKPLEEVEPPPAPAPEEPPA